ncbi:MAG TPA: sigma-54 dependent transcriptional regulator [Polyangiaceae bacterium]
MKPRALVVDDDKAVRYTLRGFLEDEGIEVQEAPDGEAALTCLAQQSFDLVISDLRMPKVDGMELLRRSQSLTPRPRIVLVTAHGSERHAVEAMKLGALDYFRKPFNEQEIVGVVRRAIGTIELEQENEQLRGAVNLLHSLVFASPAMAELAVLIQRIAPRNVTVLITGESGTGKERVAEAIVRASARVEKRFVRFNCAALAPELAEAELFGHARGAFTGAVRSRSGLFREADGGTLLLDEVAELSAETQAKLLRVIQCGEVRPVGEDHTYRVDVRLLAATHRDLGSLITSGRFREDLFYRLNVATLRVPPLRERPEDIPVLARHFLAQATARFGLPPVEIDSHLMEQLKAYAWPGNVRELQNSIERAAVMSADGTLDAAFFPDPTLPAPELALPMKFKERVMAYERSLIATALDAAKGNQSEAARLLDLSRATLQDKMRKHGFVKGESDSEV